MGGSEFVGRVVSNRMQKTVVVAVDRLIWQTKYKVWQKRTSKIMAHDEKQEYNIGDVVQIKALYRQLSKNKSYEVSKLVRRVPVYQGDRAKQLAEQWEGRGQITSEDRVAQAADAVQAAEVRLRLLREKVAQDLGLDLGVLPEVATQRSDSAVRGAPSHTHSATEAGAAAGRSSSSQGASATGTTPGQGSVGSAASVDGAGVGVEGAGGGSVGTAAAAAAGSVVEGEAEAQAPPTLHPGHDHSTASKAG